MRSPRIRLRAVVGMYPHGSSTGMRMLGLAMLSLTVIASYLFFTSSSQAQAASTTWKSFHDPVYGFSLSYPATWQLIPEQDGSHITLLDPATGTTLSPIVTTQAGTPADALKQARPRAGAINVQTRLVAGHQAWDSVSPFVPGPLTVGKDGARAPAQTRSVVLAVQNQAGTTNVYTFLLTQPTDRAGKVSAAVKADSTTFEAILKTFALPPTVAPVAPASGHSCDAVCWADANWQYNYYDDSDGPYAVYCDTAGYNVSYSTDPECTDGNLYGAQVPATNDAYFQPNFQCTDYVSRALSQMGLTPSLNNGGVNGSTPASTPNSGFGYGYYPFTSTPYASDSINDLIDVGVPGILGLYNYLLDTGLGTNVHQNLSQARPGDVIFFYDNGSISDANRAHAVIVTATFQRSGQWDALLDGHNVATYHDDFLTNWFSVYGKNYEIIHLNATHGTTAQASLHSDPGTSWTSFTDDYGQAASYVETAEDSKGHATAWAQFSDEKETVACAVAIYVPSGNALANLTFQVQLSNGTWVSRTVNELNIDGWALLYKWGELSAVPRVIRVGNNTGQYGSNAQLMGIGQMSFIC